MRCLSSFFFFFFSCSVSNFVINVIHFSVFFPLTCSCCVFIFIIVYCPRHTSSAAASIRSPFLSPFFSPDYNKFILMHAKQYTRLQKSANVFRSPFSIFFHMMNEHQKMSKICFFLVNFCLTQKKDAD